MIRIKIKELILLIDFLVSISAFSAQNTVNYSVVEKKMNLITSTGAKTPVDVAEYIKICFKTDEEKTKATYYWISQNFTYDVDKMNIVNFYENEQELIDEFMLNHKGICMHFATLFSRICNLAGVETFVVTGFTRQNGKVDVLTHAWNIALINSKWELFDPTWGAGYLQNGKYIKHLSYQYLNPKPEVFVKSHDPFDPIWQLLDFPVSNIEFIQGKTNIIPQKPLFNFNDSIIAYKKLSATARLIISNRRMKNNGLEHPILQKRYSEIISQIGRYRKNDMIDIYNLAIQKYNNGVNDLNDFINYRNKQFTPTKPDSVIKMMLETIENSFNECLSLMSKMDYPDSSTEYSKQQLTKSVETASQNLDEQKKFLDKYFSTPKLFRKSVFYKYTWMGIPLN